ncbi:unnamed protein product [Caenorhabditis auriculariae]|uniref:PKD/REJ-like domain-containing protein n=1 Tax=Caenorhabditis auriculariae TaxID=2777116 RepID=A0A8S1GZE2_9PELO|nr:unnamed protein product [Caenorhabditis auriculariae]
MKSSKKIAEFFRVVKPCLLPINLCGCVRFCSTGKEYVATSHLQTLTCQLDALREVGTSKVFAVRQKALLDATLRWQDPIQVETEKSEEFPAIVATLSSDLLGINIISHTSTVYPNFTVIYPPEVMPCKDIVRFEVKQVTGNGMMPMTFKWIVINGSTAFSTLASSTNERVLQVPRVELAKNNIFVVVGCNIADKCTTTQPLLVQLVDESTIFSVSMEGYEPSAPTSMGLKLLAMPSLQQCNITLTPNDVQYEWLINDKFVTYDDTIRLPAYSYNANQIVNVTLTANYKDSKLFRVIDAKMIRYTDLPLSVSVDCSKRQVAADQDLSIDATATDPNSKKSTIEFNWQCEAVNGTAEAMSPTCGIIGIDWNAKTLKIFAGRLKEKQTLNFSVTVTASEKQAAAFCIVVVAAKRLPDISFSILAEKKENINDFIRIQALVTSSGSQLNATWEVVRDGNNGFFSISTFLHSPTNIVRQVPPNSRIVVSLTIPPRSANVDGWTGLLAGKRYTIRLWATNSEGTSFADLAITTNSPPQKGSIEVTCANPCVALVSPVTFTVGDAFNGTEIPCNERLAFAALLSVCDRLESCTTSDSEKFEVVHPENISIAFSDMITSFNTDLVNGNVFAALVKFYVMDLEVCRKSMDVTTADRGGAYTAIQAQSVNCNIQGWNATYKISGTKDENHFLFIVSIIILLLEVWRKYILLSARLSGQRFFFPIRVRRQSLRLALPTSKSQVEYTANIPIFGYKTVDYYNCLLFHPRTGWDSTSCTSSSFATKKNDKDFISCTCSAYGILGVFTVSPPAPLHLPDHNEISLTFTVTTTRMMTQAQAQLVILSLGSMAEIDTRRFVNVATRGDPSGINSTLKATLRPPFKTEHLSNSYTIQALQKVIAAQQPDKFFKITNFTYWIVTREMNADGNARKIISKIDRSYQNIIGNNSDIISKRWSSSITTMLRISEYRIKNANIFMGIIFNFTITVPFESEKSPLSAEEISLMIQECSKYNELSFLSDQGESLEPNVIQDTDIVQLVVIHETNKLVLVIIVVLCAVLGLGSLYIGGAIVVKIRTDRLIEEERRRAVLVDPFLVSPPPPPPEYGNTTSSFAPTTVGQQYPHRRNRIEARHY